MLIGAILFDERSLNNDKTEGVVVKVFLVSFHHFVENVILLIILDDEFSNGAESR